MYDRTAFGMVIKISIFTYSKMHIIVSEVTSSSIICKILHKVF